ncbi:hypothetical protein GCM10018785_14720 [Streptomyces longispororuber]|uniref:Uncharacterized protein n=1 Tax=Streptomyces longispororuber TaxID=68230 RepID=A0A918ZCI0_9ACTN|nr:hypothetical protein [Streptomyces longispororuber]GHE46063.1 hypothetical protein GCM10018785_14720 [Streptomyces longispororuber]
MTRSGAAGSPTPSRQARTSGGGGASTSGLGPLLLSVVAARRVAGLLWAGLAPAGVALLGRGGFDRLDTAGAVRTGRS